MVQFCIELQCSMHGNRAGCVVVWWCGGGGGGGVRTMPEPCSARGMLSAAPAHCGTMMLPGSDAATHAVHAASAHSAAVRAGAALAIVRADAWRWQRRCDPHAAATPPDALVRGWVAILSTQVNGVLCTTATIELHEVFGHCSDGVCCIGGAWLGEARGRGRGRRLRNNALQSRGLQPLGRRLRMLVAGHRAMRAELSAHAFFHWTGVASAWNV